MLLSHALMDMMTVSSKYFPIKLKFRRGNKYIVQTFGDFDIVVVGENTNNFKWQSP
jgi:hypothetical protein